MSFPFTSSPQPQDSRLAGQDLSNARAVSRMGLEDDDYSGADFPVVGSVGWGWGAIAGGFSGGGPIAFRIPGLHFILIDASLFPTDLHLTRCLGNMKASESGPEVWQADDGAALDIEGFAFPLMIC